MAVAAAVLVAGCGGDRPLPELEPLGAEPPAREAGLAALRFVQAARSGDVPTMRRLLSAPTRASFGPGAAEEVARQLEGFADARIVLAADLGDGWGVGAVSGRDEDGDPAAWAAALRREEGAWRVELGGVFFTRLRPQPLKETEPDPEIRVEAQAGGEVDDVRVWLDSRELRAHAFRRAPFTREVWGRLAGETSPGVHTLVAFAVAGETAGAFAWPFEVDD